MEKFETAFVALKSYNTLKAVETIRKTVKPGGTVFTLQNGLQGGEILHKNLGKDYKVIVGCTTSGARVDEPGIVNWNGKGWTKVCFLFAVFHVIHYISSLQKIKTAVFAGCNFSRD